MKNIASISEFKALIEEKDAVLCYFSHDRCNVCKSLKPKLASDFESRYPKMEQVYIDIEKLPELAAQESVFTVPVITVFFAGRESIRKARNVGVDELANEIKRPYNLLFEE